MDIKEWNKVLRDRAYDPVMIFDLVCLQNYIKGQLGMNLPVETSRYVCEKLQRRCRQKEKKRAVEYLKKLAWTAEDIKMFTEWQQN